MCILMNVRFALPITIEGFLCGSKNKFYGYLNRIIEFECRNGNTVLLNESRKKSPSKETIQRFYDEVELKLRKKKEYSNDDWLNI